MRSKKFFTKILILEIASRRGLIGCYKRYKAMSEEIRRYGDLTYENYCKCIIQDKLIEDLKHFEEKFINKWNQLNNSKSKIEYWYPESRVNKRIYNRNKNRN